MSQFLKGFVAIFIALFTTQIILESAYAGSFKLRAREHFEFHTVKVGATESKYKGFSNTINAWYEVPYQYSLGLSISPLLGSGKIDSATTPTEFGTVIQLYSWGVEGKYFLNKFVQNFFLRLGLGYSELRARGTLPKSTGWNAYYGFGYEVPFETFGLALEMAARQSQLENGVSVFSITPSVGFHFYKKL